jgi:trk system potassium uptake protein TrkA
MKNKKQFAVLGLGRFGQAVVKTLTENGYEVLCCDKSPELVSQIMPYATDAVQADISDESALKEMGLNNYDVVIITTGDSLESAVMATMAAKEMGVKKVITKARDVKQANILYKVGADKVVLPERDMGRRLATSLITSNILEYISFSDNYGIAEIAPKDEWIGKSLVDSNIRANTGLNVVAIKRGNDVIVSPSPKEIIQAADILVIIGRSDNIEKYN